MLTANQGPTLAQLLIPEFTGSQRSSGPEMPEGPTLFCGIGDYEQSISNKKEALDELLLHSLLLEELVKKGTQPSQENLLAPARRITAQVKGQRRVNRGTDSPKGGAPRRRPTRRCAPLLRMATWGLPA